MVRLDAEKREALTYIIDVCHTHLSLDNEVYNYLSVKRKLKDSTIEKFKLGAFPKDLKPILAHVDAEILRQLKIAWVSSFDGNGICKFRDHYQFITPIYDAYGAPEGIMGRFLGTEDERNNLGIHKYDNSDYPKYTTLFGLNMAKPNIKEKDKVLVVEGMMDVIKSHQHGIDTVVATGGAFFKWAQLAKLGRYTSNVYLGFDNDEAGDKALARSMKMSPDGIKLIEKRPPKRFKDIDEFLDHKYSQI